MHWPPRQGVRPKISGNVARFAIAFVLLLLPVQGAAQETRPAGHALMADFDGFTDRAQALEARAKAMMDDAAAHPFTANGEQEGYADFLANVEAFAAASAALSVKIDTLGGPRDLRCIYRGMAADARMRAGLLTAAKTAGAAAPVFKDLRALFADAQDVTPKDMAMFADQHDGP